MVNDERANGVEVNGRRYALPKRPTVVVTIDGCDPRYVDDALDRRLMPRLAEMLRGEGSYHSGLAQMPSFTNVNNISIVTGRAPSVHGIVGNHYLGPDGREVPLNDPLLLRATTILTGLAEAGVSVLSVTAKDKLRPMLTAGGTPGTSAERASAFPLPDYDIGDVEALVGRPAPGIYDWELSPYVFEIALAVSRAVGPIDLIYLSTTDFVQHTAGPGHPLSDRLLARLDRLIGALLDEGYVLGITADHGMNDKHRPDGSPNVLYLLDELERAGIERSRVVLPVTDPYVVHHAALGSFAWIWCPEEVRARARDVVAALPGVDLVLNREEAAATFDHPEDRIGDLSVCADARTVLGKAAAGHDLSVLRGPLRSHGGRAEQAVPIIVSHRLKPEALAHRPEPLRNSDIHDLVLNGVA